MGRREGRRPFGRPRRRWEDNIKVDMQVVGAFECGNELSGSIKCGEFIDYLDLLASQK